MIRKRNWLKLINILVLTLVILATCIVKIKIGSHKSVEDNVNMRVESNFMVQENKYMSGKNITPHIDPITGRKYVTYEDFEDKSNKDDYYKIISAHSYANMNHCDVKATKNRYDIYMTNATSPINVKTNIDWNGANIYIHDEKIADNVGNQSIFRISGYSNCTILNSEEKLKGITINKNIKQVEKLQNYGHSICIIYNNNKLQFKRSGVNYQGDPQTDVIEIDNEGNILSDVLWNFENITKIIILNIPEEQLEIKNGNFITILNGKENEKLYYNRNIICERSNVIIKNITHTIDDTKKIGGPYYGFLRILNSAYVTVKDCTLYAHEYKKTSNYDFAMQYSAKITIENLQCNDIDDRARWGCVVTGYTKDITYKNCTLNRIDAHTGIHNLTIEDCNIGYGGICIVGSGTLNITNTTNDDERGFVILRSDYGSTWNGTINIKNCTYKRDGEITIIDAKAVKDKDNRIHDYGYELFLPSINIDGFKIDGKNSNIGYIYYNTDEKCDNGGDFSQYYTMPNNISISNIQDNLIIKPYLNTYSSFNLNNYKNEYITNICNEMQNEIEKLNNTELKAELCERVRKYEETQSMFQEDTQNLYSEIIDITKKYYNSMKIKPDAVWQVFNILDSTSKIFKINFEEDTIDSKMLKESINELIEKYNANTDIDISNETNFVNTMKDLYENSINTDSKQDNYSNKLKISKLYELTSIMLEDDISSAASSEAKNISASFSSTEPTNKDVTATINLPNNSYIKGYQDGKIVYTENAKKQITVVIRGYEFTYEIAVTNIDKEAPTISNIIDGVAYLNEASPKVSDTNLSDVKLYYEGQAVNNYYNGAKLTDIGSYIIIATDKAGNESRVNFSIYEVISEKYDISGNYIKNITKKTQGTQVANNINVKSEYELIRNNSKINSSDKVATGDILKVGSSTFTLIVTGDITKTSDVNVKDLVKLRKCLIDTEKLTEIERLAADVNEDTKINVKDLVGIRKLILK